MFNLCSDLLSRAAAGAGGAAPSQIITISQFRLLIQRGLQSTRCLTSGRVLGSMRHAYELRSRTLATGISDIKHIRIGLQTTKCKSTDTVTAKADDYYTRLRLRTKREVDTSSRRPDVHRSARTHSLTSLRRSRLCNLCSL